MSGVGEEGTLTSLISERKVKHRSKMRDPAPETFCEGLEENESVLRRRLLVPENASDDKPKLSRRSKHRRDSESSSSTKPKRHRSASKAEEDECDEFDNMVSKKRSRSALDERSAARMRGSLCLITNDKNKTSAPIPHQPSGGSLFDRIKDEGLHAGGLIDEKRFDEEAGAWANLYSQLSKPKKETIRRQSNELNKNEADKNSGMDFEANNDIDADETIRAKKERRKMTKSTKQRSKSEPPRLLNKRNNKDNDHASPMTSFTEVPELTHNTKQKMIEGLQIPVTPEDKVFEDVLRADDEELKPTLTEMSEKGEKKSKRKKKRSKRGDFKSEPEKTCNLTCKVCPRSPRKINSREKKCGPFFPSICRRRRGKSAPCTTIEGFAECVFNSMTDIGYKNQKLGPRFPQIQGLFVPDLGFRYGKDLIFGPPADLSEGEDLPAGTSRTVRTPEDLNTTKKKGKAPTDRVGSPDSVPGDSADEMKSISEGAEGVLTKRSSRASDSHRSSVAKSTQTSKRVSEDSLKSSHTSRSSHRKPLETSSMPSTVGRSKEPGEFSDEGDSDNASRRSSKQAVMEPPIVLSKKTSSVTFEDVNETQKPSSPRAIESDQSECSVKEPSIKSIRSPENVPLPSEHTLQEDELPGHAETSVTSQSGEEPSRVLDYKESVTRSDHSSRKMSMTSKQSSKQPSRVQSESLPEEVVHRSVHSEGHARSPKESIVKPDGSPKYSRVHSEPELKKYHMEYQVPKESVVRSTIRIEHRHKEKIPRDSAIPPEPSDSDRELLAACDEHRISCSEESSDPCEGIKDLCNMPKWGRECMKGNIRCRPDEFIVLNMKDCGRFRTPKKGRSDSEQCNKWTLEMIKNYGSCERSSEPDADFITAEECRPSSCSCDGSTEDTLTTDSEVKTEPYQTCSYDSSLDIFTACSDGSCDCLKEHGERKSRSLVVKKTDSQLSVSSNVSRGSSVRIIIKGGPMHQAGGDDSAENDSCHYRCKKNYSWLEHRRGETDNDDDSCQSLRNVASEGHGRSRHHCRERIMTDEDDTTNCQTGDISWSNIRSPFKVSPPLEEQLGINALATKQTERYRNEQDTSISTCREMAKSGSKDDYRINGAQGYQSKDNERGRGCADYTRPRHKPRHEPRQTKAEYEFDRCQDSPVTKGRRIPDHETPKTNIRTRESSPDSSEDRTSRCYRHEERKYYDNERKQVNKEHKYFQREHSDPRDRANQLKTRKVDNGVITQDKETSDNDEVIETDPIEKVNETRQLPRGRITFKPKDECSRPDTKFTSVSVHKGNVRMMSSPQRCSVRYDEEAKVKEQVITETRIPDCRDDKLQKHADMEAHRKRNHSADELSHPGYKPISGDEWYRQNIAHNAVEKRARFCSENRIERISVTKYGHETYGRNTYSQDSKPRSECRRRQSVGRKNAQVNDSRESSLSRRNGSQQCKSNGNTRRYNPDELNDSNEIDTFQHIVTPEQPEYIPEEKRMYWSVCRRKLIDEEIRPQQKKDKSPVLSYPYQSMRSSDTHSNSSATSSAPPVNRYSDRSKPPAQSNYNKSTKTQRSTKIFLDSGYEQSDEAKRTRPKERPHQHYQSRPSGPVSSYERDFDTDHIPYSKLSPNVTTDEMDTSPVGPGFMHSTRTQHFKSHLYDDEDDFHHWKSLSMLSKNQNSSYSFRCTQESVFKEDLLCTDNAYLDILDTRRATRHDIARSSNDVRSRKNNKMDSNNSTDSERLVTDCLPDDVDSLPSFASIHGEPTEAFEHVREKSVQALSYAAALSKWSSPYKNKKGSHYSKSEFPLCNAVLKHIGAEKNCNDGKKAADAHASHSVSGKHSHDSFHKSEISRPDKNTSKKIRDLSPAEPVLSTRPIIEELDTEGGSRPHNTVFDVGDPGAFSERYFSDQSELTDRSANQATQYQNKEFDSKTSNRNKYEGFAELPSDRAERIRLNPHSTSVDTGSLTEELPIEVKYALKKARQKENSSHQNKQVHNEADGNKKSPRPKQKDSPKPFYFLGDSNLYLPNENKAQMPKRNDSGENISCDESCPTLNNEDMNDKSILASTDSSPKEDACSRLSMCTSGKELSQKQLGLSAITRDQDETSDEILTVFLITSSKENSEPQGTQIGTAGSERHTEADYIYKPLLQDAKYTTLYEKPRADTKCRCHDFKPRPRKSSSDRHRFEKLSLIQEEDYDSRVSGEECQFWIKIPDGRDKADVPKHITTPVLSLTTPDQELENSQCGSVNSQAIKSQTTDDVNELDSLKTNPEKSCGTLSNSNHEEKRALLRWLKQAVVKDLRSGNNSNPGDDTPNDSASKPVFRDVTNNENGLKLSGDSFYMTSLDFKDSLSTPDSISTAPKCLSDNCFPRKEDALQNAKHLFGIADQGFLSSSTCYSSNICGEQVSSNSIPGVITSLKDVALDVPSLSSVTEGVTGLHNMIDGTTKKEIRNIIEDCVSKIIATIPCRRKIWEASRSSPLKPHLSQRWKHLSMSQNNCQVYFSHSDSHLEESAVTPSESVSEIQCNKGQSLVGDNWTRTYSHRHRHSSWCGDNLVPPVHSGFLTDRFKLDQSPNRYTFNMPSHFKSSFMKNMSWRRLQTVDESGHTRFAILRENIFTERFHNRSNNKCVDSPLGTSEPVIRYMEARSKVSISCQLQEQPSVFQEYSTRLDRETSGRPNKHFCNGYVVSNSMVEHELVAWNRNESANNSGSDDGSASDDSKFMCTPDLMNGVLDTKFSVTEDTGKYTGTLDSTLDKTFQPSFSSITVMENNSANCEQPFHESDFSQRNAISEICGQFSKKHAQNHPHCKDFHPYCCTNRLAHYAGRNRNGSGNIVSSDVPQTERKFFQHFRTREEGDSEEDYISAAEDFTQSISGEGLMKPRSSHRSAAPTEAAASANGDNLCNRGERDGTCNHTQTAHYYMGDGKHRPHEEEPREDILMSISPCFGTESDPGINGCRYRKLFKTEEYGQGKIGSRMEIDQASSDARLAQLDAQLRSCQRDNAKLDMRRPFCGQGDTQGSKRTAFTQWFIDEAEQYFQRGANALKKEAHRKDTSVEKDFKASENLEGLEMIKKRFLEQKAREFFEAKNSQTMDTKIKEKDEHIQINENEDDQDEDEEEEEEDEEEEEEGDEEEEEEEDGSGNESIVEDEENEEEQIEENFDDDEEREEVDDDDEEDEEGNDAHRNYEDEIEVVDRGDEESSGDFEVQSEAIGLHRHGKIFKDPNLKKNSRAHRQAMGAFREQDLTKKFKITAKRPTGSRFRYQGKNFNIPAIQKKTQNFHLRQSRASTSMGPPKAKEKPVCPHQARQQELKNRQNRQFTKFSFDDLKVPCIKKERVRFACDQNGDWAEIGRGSYGCVYLGLLDGSMEVAIKDFYESSSWDLVIHEARMLLYLQSTGITPKFYGLRRRFDVTKEPSEYCIIMEYFGDGRTLFNVMSDKISLSRDEWMDVIGQLVAGLRMIHRKNVLINDLKADNILIDLSPGRKLIRYIDVGMATYKHGLTFQLPKDQMNKYNFLAPEVREGAHTSTKSDIYSLGYMLEQICRLADGNLGELDRLVRRCMDKNPNQRPTIDMIVSQVHRFISSKATVRPMVQKREILLTNSI